MNLSFLCVYNMPVPFMLAKTNFSCIYSLVDNACDMNIPVMEVNGIELTAEAEQG